MKSTYSSEATPFSTVRSLRKLLVLQEDTVHLFSVSKHILWSFWCYQFSTVRATVKLSLVERFFFFITKTWCRWDFNEIEWRWNHGFKNGCTHTRSIGKLEKMSPCAVHRRGWICHRLTTSACAGINVTKITVALLESILTRQGMKNRIPIQLIYNYILKIGPIMNTFIERALITLAYEKCIHIF